MGTASRVPAIGAGQEMIDWLAAWFDDKPARVLRCGLERLYELEKRKAGEPAYGNPKK